MKLALAYELAIRGLQVRVLVLSTRVLSEFSTSHRQKHTFTPRSITKSFTRNHCLKNPGQSKGQRRFVSFFFSHSLFCRFHCRFYRLLIDHEC